MDSIIDYINNHLIIFIIIGVLLVIIVYSVFAVLLNKLSSAKRGKTTILAWIPVLNIYLLGELVVHSIVGFILAFAFLFGICISFDIPNLEVIHNLLPLKYVLPYQVGFSVIILILVIVGKLKLNRIIREGTGKDVHSLFINKDFDEKEPEVVVNNNSAVKNSPTIADNFNYNNASSNVTSQTVNTNKEQDSSSNP